MRINTRFSMAVHIMAMMELRSYKYTDITLTSAVMANSVNTNPVVIRRIIAALKKAGLVEVKAGVGGAELKRAPQEISLLDIYNAVKTSEDTTLFDVHKNTCQQCYVGANIHGALANPLSEAQKAMEDKLSMYTLMDVLEPIVKKYFGS